MSLTLIVTCDCCGAKHVTEDFHPNGLNVVKREAEFVLREKDLCSDCYAIIMEFLFAADDPANKTIDVSISTITKAILEMQERRRNVLEQGEE